MMRKYAFCAQVLKFSASCKRALTHASAFSALSLAAIRFSQSFAQVKFSGFSIISRNFWSIIERRSGCGAAMKFRQTIWWLSSVAVATCQSERLSNTLLLMKPMPRLALIIVPTDSISATSIKCLGTMPRRRNSFSMAPRTAEPGSRQIMG